MNDRDQENLWEESEVEKGKQALHIQRSGELQGGREPGQNSGLCDYMKRNLVVKEVERLEKKKKSHLLV